MGTHLRVLIESYLIITNMTRIRWFSKTIASLCFGGKLVLALEGLGMKHLFTKHQEESVGFSSV